MQRYKIQVAHTFEFVTVSTHDDWDDAQDSAIEQIQLHGEDRVRIVHLDTHEGDVEEDVYDECRSAQAAGEEISDACAKAIGQWYQSPALPDTVSFTSHGTIAEGLWRKFTDNGALYEAGDSDEKLALDMLGTYLINRENKGPVKGW